ncbi:MAG: hypothetical protein QNK36_13845 [Colwellia sp.]|nr:hypothetical protein [Colwellia sp.]
MKQLLKNINIKSHQLLKRLEYDVDTDENLAVDDITQLQAARDQLISSLFNQYSNDEIQKELELINQMVSLDADLQIKTKKLKQFFANKLIKIQKGKKSALTYKKY